VALRRRAQIKRRASGLNLGGCPHGWVVGGTLNVVAASGRFSAWNAG
jgi:hypothetical protein